MPKSVGEANFRPPKPLNQVRCHVKCTTTSSNVVEVQSLVGVDSAVTDMRMREKKVSVEFLLTYLSVRFFVGLQVTVFG